GVLRTSGLGRALQANGSFVLPGITSGVALGNGTHAALGLRVGEPFLQTPVPDIRFRTHGMSLGGNAGDPQIAVSGTHVFLTARDAMSVYTKEGALLASPQHLRDFFRPLSD